MHKLLFNSILHTEKCNNAFLAPHIRKEETFNGLSDFVEWLLDKSDGRENTEPESKAYKNVNKTNTFWHLPMYVLFITV